MRFLKTIKAWWIEWNWSQARKTASQWKRNALYRLRELQKSSDKLERISSRIEVAYKESLVRLDTLYQQHLEITREVNARVKEAQETIDQYDHAEEMLNNELEVYREVVVPQLTLAAEIGRQQLEAEIALQVQRQVYYGAAEKNVKE